MIAIGWSKGVHSICSITVAILLLLLQVLSLKRQLQAGGANTSNLLTTSLTTNTYEYSPLTTSRYGYSSSIYPSSISSLYSSSSSYGMGNTTSSLGSYSIGDFKLSDESVTSRSTNGSYGYKPPTTTAIGRLNYGYKYQTDVSTSLSFSDSNKPATVDTIVKDEAKHVTSTAKEVTPVLPALVDITPAPALHKTVTSQGMVLLLSMVNCRVFLL